MTTATLSTRGRVKIPYALRKRYGLKKGNKLNFIDYDGVILCASASKDRIRAAEDKQDKSKGK